MPLDTLRATDDPVLVALLEEAIGRSPLDVAPDVMQLCRATHVVAQLSTLTGVLSHIERNGVPLAAVANGGPRTLARRILTHILAVDQTRRTARPVRHLLRTATRADQSIDAQITSITMFAPE